MYKCQSNMPNKCSLTLTWLYTCQFVMSLQTQHHRTICCQMTNPGWCADESESVSITPQKQNITFCVIGPDGLGKCCQATKDFLPLWKCQTTGDYFQPQIGARLIICDLWCIIVSLKWILGYWFITNRKHHSISKLEFVVPSWIMHDTVAMV